MTSWFSDRVRIALRNGLFWLFFPFVLPQAVRLRKTAPRFPDADGPRRGVVGNGSNLELVAIGDSIVAGVGATDLSSALVGQTAKALADRLNCLVTWGASGMTGADSEKVLRRLLSNPPPANADVILLSVGVNDVTGLCRISTWNRNLSGILNTLKRYSPEAAIAVAGIPPLKGFPLLPQPLRALFGIRAEAFDLAARREIPKHPGCIHVPVEFDPRPELFSADGYHPSEESYRKFGLAMAESIDANFELDRVFLRRPTRQKLSGG